MKMKKQNIDRSLTDVEKLLYKQAWKAAARYNLSFEEALSECHWLFVRACNGQYDPSRGAKLSTFLTMKIHFHFKTLNHKQRTQTQRFPLIEIDEDLAGAAPARHSPCLEATDGLSEEAQEIIRLLLETPAELVDVWEPSTPRKLLRRVKAHLCRRGRSQEQLEQAQKEIETTFRSIWAETT